MISCSFPKNDLHLKTSYGSLPCCTTTAFQSAGIQFLAWSFNSISKCGAVYHKEPDNSRLFMIQINKRPTITNNVQAQSSCDSFKRLYIVEGLLVLVEKTSFSKEFRWEFQCGGEGHRSQFREEIWWCGGGNNRLEWSNFIRVFDPRLTPIARLNLLRLKVSDSPNFFSEFVCIGFRTERIWAPSQLSVCSPTPTVHTTTISRFLHNFFRMW